MKKAQTKVENQLERIVQKWAEPEAQSPIGCGGITIKIYNKNGDCIMVKHENDSPAKSIKTKKNDFSCKSSNKHKKPMFKLKKDVVFRDLPNVMSKSIASTTKTIHKKKADMSGKVSSSSRGDLTKTSYYNRKVREGNTDFTSKLREKLRDDIYEDSSSSNTDGTFSSHHSALDAEESKQEHSQQGQLITLNLDMGKRGIYVLHGLDT